MINLDIKFNEKINMPIGLNFLEIRQYRHGVAPITTNYSESSSEESDSYDSSDKGSVSS